MLLLLAFMSLAADLSAENAADLKVAWTYQTNATPPNARAAKIAPFEATPLFTDGLLYVITPFDQVIALGKRGVRFCARLTVRRCQSFGDGGAVDPTRRL